MPRLKLSAMHGHALRHTIVFSVIHFIASKRKTETAIVAGGHVTLCDFVNSFLPEEKQL
jgi:hypothetical protein